jgi:hypothetical protein
VWRALVVLALAGCAHGRAPDPAPSLRSLADVMAAQDADAAWARLDRATRDRLSVAAFRAGFAASAAERADLAAALRRAADRGGVRLTARVGSPAEVASLTRGDEGWRVASPRPTGKGAPTPDEALRRFVQALEARDFDAFLRLLGEPLKSLVERELTDRVSALRGALGKPVAIEGDHAHIRYDARHHLDLRRENGQWQVVDFN